MEGEKEMSENCCHTISSPPQMPRGLSSEKLAHGMASADNFYREYIYNLRISNRRCVNWFLLYIMWTYIICDSLHVPEKVTCVKWPV